MKCFVKNGTETMPECFCAWKTAASKKYIPVVTVTMALTWESMQATRNICVAHQLDEYYREYYSLSNFDLTKAEICEPELDQTEKGLNMYPL